MAERRQERRFFRPERAAGRSRTRGCGLVQLGLKSQLASLLLHFVSKSVETLSFFQIRASSNRARTFFSSAASDFANQAHEGVDLLRNARPVGTEVLLQTNSAKERDDQAREGIIIVTRSTCCSEIVDEQL